MLAICHERTRLVPVMLFVVYLVVQVAVPAVMLGAGSMVRFGWQMFATPAGVPEFVVVFEDGTRHAVDLGQFVAFPRGDLPLTQVLPDHLCRVIPQAREVVVDEDQAVPCP